MPLFYIHSATCISSQQTFGDVDLNIVHQPVDSKLFAIEPAYKNVPAGSLRRMSKPVRIGMGAASPILATLPKPDGILTATANAGMEDCISFLKQMVEYDEGLLTPGSFVQSTPNALAGQLAMFNQNKSYNITHLHIGLAFENALTDAAMRLAENPTHNYLLGTVDDVSSYNYKLAYLAGWFRQKKDDDDDLYATLAEGSIPGEAATMFYINNKAEGALASVVDVAMLHTKDIAVVKERLAHFIAANFTNVEKPSLFITGENGDTRVEPYYAAIAAAVDDSVPVIRYKHYSGEFPTATAMAAWLAIQIINGIPVPQHMVKSGTSSTPATVLIYNCYRENQHSFILIRK